MVEFFLEHVTGIGQIIEGIEHEEESDEANDKPHAPVQFHFQQQQIAFVTVSEKVPVAKPVTPQNRILPVNDKVCLSGHLAGVFRPPIA